jgi:xanthine/uracil/vitamin C permease (AzgA family)
MTVVTLTDVAEARLDALSFFLFTYLVISLVVKAIWNQLAKSFASLPKLKYREALGVVFVTGVLFYVLLTMISGARDCSRPAHGKNRAADTGCGVRSGLG